MDSGAGTTDGTESPLRATPEGFLPRDEGLVCEECASWVPDDEHLAQVHRSWHERLGGTAAH